MNKDALKKNRETSGETREDRLRAALKANLAKRKEQARARKSSEQEKSR